MPSSGKMFQSVNDRLRCLVVAVDPRATKADFPTGSVDESHQFPRCLLVIPLAVIWLHRHGPCVSLSSLCLVMNFSSCVGTRSNSGEHLTPGRCLLSRWTWMIACVSRPEPTEKLLSILPCVMAGCGYGDQVVGVWIAFKLVSGSDASYLWGGRWWSRGASWPSTGRFQ